MGNDYMRDLLQKFSEAKHPFVESTMKTEEIELNLGLSLGNSLYRSSSNASTFPRSDVDLSLTRTSSLPSESLEETRKRKGLQFFMEMEAMKKRSEKQRGFKYEPISSLPSSQGSIGSQGSFSSGISELENQSAQGQNNHNGSRSPASVLSLPEQREHKPIAVPCPKPIKKMEITTESETESPLVKPNVIISCTRESETKVMEEMPCVFTKGDGPNGKRIEGLLFKYKKGEEVRIVCVCHGSFLSPAEFVKHAGGSDVAHPLRHIVVVPFASSFL